MSKNKLRKPLFPEIEASFKFSGNKGMEYALGDNQNPFLESELIFLQNS